MKFAIVAGVIQMVAGVCTKCVNCLFPQDWVTLYWVYIPEMVFINSIFGYLCILIFTKWTTNWDATYVLNNNEIVGIPQVYCSYDAKTKTITKTTAKVSAKTITVFSALHYATTTLSVPT